MAINGLAEAVILQSIEDLWTERQKEESINFFNGEGFGIFAGMAGMSNAERKRLQNMVYGILKHHEKKSKFKRLLKVA